MVGIYGLDSSDKLFIKMQLRSEMKCLKLSNYTASGGNRLYYRLRAAFNSLAWPYVRLVTEAIYAEALASVKQKKYLLSL